MMVWQEMGTGWLFRTGICLGVAGLLLVMLIWQLRFLAGTIATAGLLMCGYAWLLTSRRRWLKAVTLSLFVVIGSFLVTEVLIFRAMAVVPAASQETLIVLGAKVNGRVPSVTLQNRLQAAKQYLAVAPDAIAVVSGGQGAGEDISEAAAMEQYLREAGVAPQRILKEEQSKTTQENLRYSRAVLANAGFVPQNVVIVTSDYHLFRACTMAKKYFSGVEGVGGVSALPLRVNYAIREYFALIKMLLTE